jgi:type II secretion system protein D
VPIPGVVPAAAAGSPTANPAEPAPAVVPLGETKITEPIEELKLSGDALAGLYRKYTGRRVIVSSAASTAEFRFVQDASIKEPLTFTQAAELLKKAATIENFVFVPDEQDPSLDILTLSTGGIRPTGRGVAVYNENSPLPDGDAVISYVMTLSYIKPAEAVNTFTQIIGQFGAYGSIAPVPNAAAVVITENTSLIRKLIDLKKEIDKPSSQIGTRFIKVQFADVTEIATTLTTLLTAQQSAQKTAGVQRADGGAPAAAAAAALPGIPNPAGQAAGGTSSGEETPVQIIPDPRTNRIFAMGRPVDLLFVEGLIREFDVETSEKNFLRRKLRFLTVADFLPVAGDALDRAFSGTGEGGGGSAGGAGGAARPQGGARTQGGANSGANFGGNTGGRSGTSSASNNSRSGSSSMGGGMGGSSMGGSGGGGGGLSAPNVSSAPASVLVGRTLLVADNITNSIVVQGPPSGLEIIERLLDQIDVKPDQVMISTVIGQLTLNDEHTSGASYLGLGGDTSIFGGSGASTVLPIIPATATVPSPGIDASKLSGSGLHVYGKIGNNLNYYLEALQKKSDFTVLSRPSIFTSNNQMGTISSGEKIAIPTGSTSYGSSSNSSTQIQYQDVVLKLQVVPLVNSDNEITMQISLLNDEQNGTQSIQGGAGNGGDLTVPKISTREILTTATVPNNETIVLGGLIVGRGGNDKSGIPILCDIPLLGKLFSSTTDTKNRSELMVFIQPSIVRDSHSLNTVQENMDARYTVSERAHKFADGPNDKPVDDKLLPLEEKGKAAAPKETPKATSKPKSKANSSIQPANRK